MPDHPRKRKRRGASPLHASGWSRATREPSSATRKRARRCGRWNRGSGPGGHGRRRDLGPDRASIVVGYLAGTEVNGQKPQLAQVLAPALLMGIMAWGMWRARYWAVLGFQLILVILIFSAVYGLALQAATVGQVLATLGPARRLRRLLLADGQGDGPHPDAQPPLTLRCSFSTHSGANEQRSGGGGSIG